MARAYLCDKCGRFVKGLPPKERDPEYVGAKDADTWLTIQVWQHPTGGRKFQPDLCPDCTIGAAEAVLKDMRERGRDHADPA